MNPLRTILTAGLALALLSASAHAINYPAFAFFGPEVKEFRSVDYEAVAMLNVSATQELARKLDAKDEEIAALRERLARAVRASLK